MRIRHVLLGVLAAAVVIVTALAVVELGKRQAVEETVDIGGAFAMTAHDGRRVTERDLAGRRAVIFFGFTHCPDVCPTTVFEVVSWLEALGEEGNLVDPYFVTVDPERDTAARMAEYVAYFSPRLTGLVGTEAELERMAEAYRVYYARIDLEDGGYTMDHTAVVYLMDGEGRFFDAITMTAGFDEAVAKLRRLVRATSPRAAGTSGRHPGWRRSSARTGCRGHRRG